MKAHCPGGTRMPVQTGDLATGWVFKHLDRMVTVRRREETAVVAEGYADGAAHHIRRAVEVHVAAAVEATQRGALDPGGEIVRDGRRPAQLARAQEAVRRAWTARAAWRRRGHRAGRSVLHGIERRVGRLVDMQRRRLLRVWRGARIVLRGRWPAWVVGARRLWTWYWMVDIHCAPELQSGLCACCEVVGRETGSLVVLLSV